MDENVIMGNVLGMPSPRSDWNETNPMKGSFIRNKPIGIKEIAESEIDNLYFNYPDFVQDGIYLVTDDSIDPNDGRNQYILITSTSTDRANNGSTSANGVGGTYQLRLSPYNGKLQMRICELDGNNVVWSEWKTPNATYDGKGDVITEKYATKDEVFPTPITVVPTVLEVNTAYNFGSQNAALTLTFPSIANDGDVIYIGFVCREGLNLVVDTTNTFDFELVPEKDTGYEIYAKCTTNLGVLRWILKYSEYSGVGE